MKQNNEYYHALIAIFSKMQVKSVFYQKVLQTDHNTMAVYITLLQAPLHPQLCFRFSKNSDEKSLPFVN
jgi:hypothetical protein